MSRHRAALCGLRLPIVQLWSSLRRPLVGPVKETQLSAALRLHELGVESLCERRPFEASIPGSDAAFCSLYECNGLERGVSPGIERLGGLR